MQEWQWDGEFLWEHAGRLQRGDVTLDPPRHVSAVSLDTGASAVCVWSGTSRELYEADDPVWIFRPAGGPSDCEACGAAAEEMCRPDCLGLAALADAGEEALSDLIAGGLLEAARSASPDGNCQDCNAPPVDGFCDRHRADGVRSRQYALARAAVAQPYELVSAPRHVSVDFDASALINSVDVPEGELIGAPDDPPGLDEPWNLAEVSLPGPSGSFCMYLIPYGHRWLVCTVPMEITDIEVFTDRDAALNSIRYSIAHDMLLYLPENRPNVWTAQRVYRNGVLDGLGVVEAGHANGGFLVAGIQGSSGPFAEKAPDAARAIAALSAHLCGGTR